MELSPVQIESIPQKLKESPTEPHNPRAIPVLQIPPSSCDLLVDNRHVMNVLSVYQLLMRFWKTLRLSPFRVETFCAALTSEENTILLSDVFIALLRAVVKDDEQNGIIFGPADVLHNYSILFHLMDGLTYTEVLRLYLNGLPVSDFDPKTSNLPLSSPAAPLLDIDSNLELLQILIDHFISTNARNQLMSSPELDHEDFCRSCGKIGELICCDRCTCVMHYECIPPGNLPGNERVWICNICQKHNVAGVADCMSQFEGPQGCSRHSCLGSDRCNRKYYLMARRVIGVSADGCRCWYYSTVNQLKRLLDCFDCSIPVEKYLLNQFEMSRTEIERQMRITEVLTDSTKGNKVTYFSWEEKQAENLNIKLEVANSPSNNGTDDCVSASAKDMESLYVLGRDDEYKKYLNYFSSDEHNSLSKKQREEERIKKRTLLSRFNQSTDFRWHGNVYGTYKQILIAIRSSLVQFESMISPAFLYSTWTFFKHNWVKAVQKCETHVQFSMAISVLYSYVNPILFCAQWTDSSAVLWLRRTGATEIEERKRYEHDLLLNQTTGNPEELKSYSPANLSNSLNHKIHKQKGEEYRLYFASGWYWLSGTRMSRIRISSYVGLSMVSMKIRELVSECNNVSVKKETTESYEEDISTTVVNEMDRSRCHPNTSSSILDVSSGLLEHTIYSHWNISSAKMDFLLERRLKNIDERRSLILKTIQATGVDSVYDILNLPFSQYDEDLRGDLTSFSDLIDINKPEQENFNNDLYNMVVSWFPPTGQLQSLTNKVTLADNADGQHLSQVHRFTTNADKQSVFILPQKAHIRICRQGGLHQNNGFNYEQRVSSLFWPMPFARPSFGVGWAYRIQTVKSISALALQLKILYISFRWNQMNEQAPSSGRCVTAVDNGSITTEILERRPESGGSHQGDKIEYLVYKAFQTSMGNDRDDYYSFRQRQLGNEMKTEESYEVHEWVAEETLQLWQIRLFHERQQSHKLSPKTKPVNNLHNVQTDGRQKIKIIKHKDGGKQVYGLKSGQQLVEGPDGKWRLVAENRPDSYAPAYEPGLTAIRTSKICFERPNFKNSPQEFGKQEAIYPSNPRNIRTATRLIRTMEESEMSPQNKSIQLVVKQYTRNPDDLLAKRRLYEFFRSDPDAVKFFLHQYELSMRSGDRGDDELLFDTSMLTLESNMTNSSDDIETHHLRQTCCNVMKMMLEKVERHEKNSRRRLSHTDTSTVRQRKIISQRIMSQLHKQKESLKRSIIRKRTMTEQSIRREVKAEVQRVIDSPSVQSAVSKVKQEKKEPRATERTSTGRNNTVDAAGKNMGDLYCVCRTPYDNTKFYIGCDKCKNWFHGSCVHLTEEEAEKIESYICDECSGGTPRQPPAPAPKKSSKRPPRLVVEEQRDFSKSRKRRTRENRLYCVCRKPFDYRDYISCASCEEWFHYECVGISKGEASMLKNYNCVSCRIRHENDTGAPHRIVFSPEHNLLLGTFVGEIKVHKMSWPFIEPVSKAEFPDYYEIITEPIDLSVIEERATSCHYRYIDEFTADLNILFVNCRTYHQPTSVFYRCSENLESFVFSKIKSLLKKLFRI